MNKTTLTFKSTLENEAYARISCCAFLMPLNPSLEEIIEIKTIISEAVTNAILHGYESDLGHDVIIEMEYENNGYVTIIVKDFGKGIEDIDLAMEPMYTSKAELERSGMGMTIMQTFSDNFTITSKKDEGTTLVIKKQLQSIDES